ncbi:hypothetical protein MBANPS3_006548 [Mucor bainieri]
MAIPWEKIPLEVWMNIFDQISDTECTILKRLHRWDGPAEKAIFRGQLLVKFTEKCMNSLYCHLRRKPALIQLIKDVKLQGCRTSLSIELLQEPLLRMILNPNIEALDLSCATEDHAKLVKHIVTTSNYKLDKVKYLDSPDDCGALQHIFRGSLNDLTIMRHPYYDNSNQPDLAHLEEYKSLENFTLYFEKISLGELDAILRKLHSARHLTLSGSLQASDSVFATEAALEQWLNQSVQKDEHVKTLYATLHSPTLTKYIVYKYPELTTITPGLLLRNLEEIYPYIAHIPKIDDCILDFHTAEDLAKIGLLMKSASNTITISYDPDEHTGCVKFSKSTITNHSSFLVTLKPNSSHEYFRKLLSSVSAEESDITDLTVDLVHCRGETRGRKENIDLYYILNMAPRVQKLEFSDSYISFDARKVLPALDDLHTLELCRGYVDSKVISQIGKKAPNLKHLTLASCLVLENCKVDDNRYRVVLPNVALKSLTFSIKRWIWCFPEYEEWEYEEDPKLKKMDRPEMDELEDMEADLKEMQTVYLHIKIKNARDQYFRLEPGTKKAVLSGKGEFDMNSKNATAVYIECESLSLFSVKWGEICVDLRFGNDKRLNNKGELLMPPTSSLQMEQEHLDLRTRYNALKQHMMNEMNVSPARIEEIENQASSSSA